MSKPTFTMGGTATVQQTDELQGFLVAMTGDFRGGAFARHAQPPKELPAGVTQLELEHFFIREDGSTIQTRDQGTLTPVPGTNLLAVRNHYNVVKATGAFEGLKGTFDSFGALDTSNGKGILRFWGTLSE